MSIQGIGLITAMVIMTEINDIHRFSNQEKLTSYVGAYSDRSFQRR